MCTFRTTMGKSSFCTRSPTNLWGMDKIGKATKRSGLGIWFETQNVDNTIGSDDPIISMVGCCEEAGKYDRRVLCMQTWWIGSNSTSQQSHWYHWIASGTKWFIALGKNQFRKCTKEYTNWSAETYYWNGARSWWTGEWASDTSTWNACVAKESQPGRSRGPGWWQQRGRRKCFQVPQLSSIFEVVT